MKPPRERVIVGLGVFVHDTSVAIMRDGQVLFAAEQERFDRHKHSQNIPVDALNAGLRWCGLQFSDIDEIVVNYDGWAIWPPYFRHIWRFLPKTLRMAFDYRRFNNARKMGGYKNNLRQRFGAIDHIAFRGVRHHLAHAASAAYQSPFSSSAILTSDVMGEFESMFIGTWCNNSFEAIGQNRYPESLGAVYAAVTDHLGFKMFSGEGTVMGLAAYGKPFRKYDMSHLISTNGTKLKVDLSYFRYHVLPFLHSKWVTRKFGQRFGPRRTDTEPINNRHANVAYSLQRLSDQVLVSIAKELRNSSGEANVCLAGGSMLNCYSNRQILAQAGFDSVFVQPAANDAGTALGAVLYRSHVELGIPRSKAVVTTSLGPSFSDDEYEEALRLAGLSFEKPPELGLSVAKRLSEGNVVGWFQGRMEFGPRALGNRSILADPRNPCMRDYLNKCVKHREPFRPFAPMVLEEDAANYFVMPCRSLPYMLVIVDVLPKWRPLLPAITHVDGTARVQTVSHETGSQIYNLLSCWKKQTGTSVLLNTSFNGKGEPIVCTPKEAVQTFRRAGLDDLVLGPYLARSKNPQPGIRKFEQSRM